MEESKPDSPLGALLKDLPTLKTVTLFLTGMPLGWVPAELAEALRLVNLEAIPRIYFTLHRYYPPDPITKYRGAVSIRYIGSTLRGIFGLPNVRFSVVSLKPVLMLVCASYSNKTFEFQPSPESPLGLLNA
jgi:hypothetical protein